MIFILLYQRAAVMHVVFPALRTYAIPFDALNEGDSLELSGSYFRMGKLERLSYNLVKVA